MQVILVYIERLRIHLGQRHRIKGEKLSFVTNINFLSFYPPVAEFATRKTYATTTMYTINQTIGHVAAKYTISKKSNFPKFGFKINV